MTGRRTLPRARCAWCGRQVPVITERRGQAGSVSRLRFHSKVPGGQMACAGSRVQVETGPPPGIVRPLSYWCGPRTWEEAGL